MNKTLTSIAIAAMTAIVPCVAQTTTITTTTTTTETVTITKGTTEPMIDGVNPGRWDLSRIFNKKKENRSSTKIGSAGLYAGGLIPTGSHTGITGGWEMGYNNLLCAEWSSGPGLPKVSIGAGFGWEFQTVGHGNILTCDNGILSVAPAPEDAHDISSRIKRFHFTVPLSVFIPMHGNFGLSLSGELHLNTYTTASSKWRISGSEQVKHSFKGLHQKIATIDLTATIGWRDAIGFYVTYAPMNPWMSGYGPQYKTIATGATITF